MFSQNINILECTPIAQFAIGLDHKIIFWNKACELLTGLRPEDMVDTDNQWMAFYGEKRPVLADLIIAQDYKKFLRLYEGRNPRKSEIVPHAWEATAFFENMGGKARYIYFLAAPVFDDEGIMVGAVTTLQDITETKHREMTIQKESEQLQQENLKLKSSINERYRFCNIIGKSSAMQEVYELILKAAETDTNVIVYGESGSGKELVAKAVHEMSSRSHETFLPVNCGAIPENLLEAEFFGHVKGAFTGAHADQEGFLDQASDGTLFLDEIGELDMNMQVKLLRAIEGGGFTAVGSRKVRHSNFRIIAATNRNLIEEVNASRMRRDFFYRIHIIPINLPPLRDRKEDIPLLIDHFLKQGITGAKQRTLPGKVLEAMYNYDWPGNVRELQNVLHRYLTLKQLDFMGRQPGDMSTGGMVDAMDDGVYQFTEAVDNFEKRLIVKALDKHHWHRTEAAEELGISRRTLFRKMKKIGIL